MWISAAKVAREILLSLNSCTRDAASVTTAVMSMSPSALGEELWGGDGVFDHESLSTGRIVSASWVSGCSTTCCSTFSKRSRISAREWSCFLRCYISERCMKIPCRWGKFHTHVVFPVICLLDLRLARSGYTHSVL